MKFSCVLVATLSLVLLHKIEALKLPTTSEEANLAKSVRFDDLVDAEDDGSSLYYNTELDDAVGREASETSKQLQALMSDIVKSNGSSDDQCGKHKARINQLCLARFHERSRYKVVLAKGESSNNNRLFYDDGAPEVIDSEQPTAKIASPQQVCCEFRLSYMKCLVSNINFVCSPTEFNQIYDQHRGLAEICSRFFAKSGKKCRKRYRQAKPIVVQASGANTTLH